MLFLVISGDHSIELKAYISLNSLFLVKCMFHALYSLKPCKLAHLYIPAVSLIEGLL